MGNSDGNFCNRACRNKQEWRSLLRARRLLLTDLERRCLEEAVAQVLRLLDDVRILGVYWPMQAEPDLRAVFSAWKARTGGQLAYPRCTGFGRMEYAFPADWAPDAEGIHSPTGKAVIPSVLFVPCLGWSKRGFRLGYGKGYFDRYIAPLGSRVSVVGLGWESGMVPDGLFGANDCPLDGILTARGWHAAAEKRIPAQDACAGILDRLRPLSVD